MSLFEFNSLLSMRVFMSIENSMKYQQDAKW